MPAPTVTMQDVLDSIKEEKYFHDGLLTICRLTMSNGTKVIGESACASPDRYNKEEGEGRAKEKALQEVWPRLGYALREKLHLIDKAGKPFGRITEIGSPVTYVGTKVIHAISMDRQQYNDLRGWTVPSDENPEDLGYLVQYADGGPSNVEGFSGYISWSPRDVFEKAYDVGIRQEPKNLISSLVEERDQLAMRVEETVSFIHSDSFNLMSLETQGDLHQQLEAMQLYLAVLNTRVNRVI